MLSKKDFITELYKRIIKDVTSDSVAWRAFLHSASYQYKYPFEDQVLIYAQRPFATACADFDTWHKEPLNRRINRGAKGIALIRERGGRVYLDHVFDVKDTNSPENEAFEIWNVKPGYEDSIIEALGNRFGDINTTDNLTSAVMGACINLGQDNIQDYVQEMMYSTEGSFLEDLDEDNLRYRLLLTVQASVSYLVLTRLGLDAETNVPPEAFEWVHEFNTPATVNILGAATADISEICLREIERTVRSLDKENRTFDRTADVGYNEGGKNETEKGGNDNVELHDREGRDAVPDLDSPDLIVANPVDKVDRPKRTDYHGSFYNEEEMQDLFEAVKGSKLELPVMLSAFYGLRRSEVLGLKWDAIDFQQNTITIKHTITSCKVDGKLVEVASDTTKTKSSRRTLPLVPQFRDMLRQRWEMQEEYKRVCGRCYNREFLDYVCVDEMGNIIRPNYLTTSFQVLLEKNGMRKIRFHDLRHTCASLLLKNGVPMKQIQEWLGHSDFSTTANIYAHLDYNSKLNSADAMISGMSGALNFVS